ncbi:MAG: glycerol-3-phosphate 1-O-acyltransferase PlsY [Proteobacteria bacterium]|nr:glycerol-3-phosphate 1-O-acyltransferase PlsY [Pseudomonadota bacterium]
MTELLLLLMAYLLGSIPTGVLLARIYGGKDLSKEGSGNIGATNVGRVVGKKAGLITLVGDCLKGILPLVITMAVAGRIPWLISAVALTAFLGHLYPVFNKFKGGKGVATALGVFLVVSPLATLLAVITFALILYLWRYVSLGSIIAAGIMPALMGIFASSKIYIVLAVLVGGLVIYRHRENIKRLIEGKENKFGGEKEANAQRT